MLRAALVVTSIIVSLLLGELFTRFIYGTPNRWLSPQVRHEIFEGRYRMVPGQSAFSGDAEVRVNSLGYRGGEWPISRGNGNYRIWILGDSIALGNLVKEHDTFPVQLNILLNSIGIKATVLTSAVMGWSTFHQLDVLKSEWNSALPTVVVLSFFYNDFNTPESAVKATSLQQNGNIEGRPAWLRWLPYEAIYGVKRSALFTLLRNRIDELAQKFRGDKDALFFRSLLSGDQSLKFHSIVTATLSYIDEITKYCKSKKVDVIVLNVPHIHSIMTKQRPLYTDWIEAVVTKGGGIFLDLYPDFSEIKPPTKGYLYPWDNHLSAEGHKLVARRLKEVVEDLGSIRINQK